jgi:hypothetical protein
MRRIRLCIASDNEPKFRLRSIGGVVVLGAAVALGTLALGPMSSAASESTQAHATALSSASSTDEQDAVASYQALQSNLYETSAQLYQGLPSNSCDPYSCLWPFTNAMVGTEFLDAIPGGASYASDVKARVSRLGAYADLHEVSPSGARQPRAYQSAVAPPAGPGGNTYYDDNAWSALDLLTAYELTGTRPTSRWPKTLSTSS